MAGGGAEVGVGGVDRVYPYRRTWRLPVDVLSFFQHEYKTLEEHEEEMKV